MTKQVLIAAGYVVRGILGVIVFFLGFYGLWFIGYCLSHDEAPNVFEKGALSCIFGFIIWAIIVSSVVHGHQP